ncbi:MAG: D-glucuronyl C5-epimerase family protein [Candidatus Omnitrophota bacterium]
MKRSNYLLRIFNSYILNKKNSNLSFWHTPLFLNKPEEEDIKGVNLYPMNFLSKTWYDNYKDEDGVIMLNYYGKIGFQYNPNAIAQQALGYYDKYLRSNAEEDKNAFLRQANYFRKFGRMVRDDVLLWEYNFPFEMRDNLSAPWRSALAQGQALSVLIRAHKLTGDNEYAQRAHKGFKSFNFLAREHEGGVLDAQDGFLWLEEYIVNSPNHVLNGFIWALWGVRDYAVYFNDKQAHKIYKECLKTLEHNLKNYDLGFWTTYDWPQGYDKKQPVMPTSLYYQNLHAVQMQACYNLTGKTFFLDYHKKWQGYLNSFWKRAVSQVWKAYFKLRHF